MKLSLRYIVVIALLLLTIPVSVSAYVFTKPLKQGDRSQDVIELQKVLNMNPLTAVALSGAGSFGNETLFFGAATKQAVIKFQNLYKNEVLTPAGLTAGTGFVGALTIKKLNTLQSTTTQTYIPPTTPTVISNPAVYNQTLKIPVITSLSTTTLQNGEKITIYGKNFTAVNKVVLSVDFPEKFNNVSSVDTTSMEFTFSSSVADKIREQLSTLKPDVRQAILKRMKEGQQPASQSGYIAATLYIVNSNGTSTPVTLNVNIINNI